MVTAGAARGEGGEPDQTRAERQQRPGLGDCGCGRAVLLKCR